MGEFNLWYSGDDLAEDFRYRLFRELNWCLGPAIFPFKGKDHLVPCTLAGDHEGPCVPDQHQKHHDCEINGCDLPHLIERYGLDREDQVQVRIMPKEIAEARRADIRPPKQKR